MFKESVREDQKSNSIAESMFHNAILHSSVLKGVK